MLDLLASQETIRCTFSLSRVLFSLYINSFKELSTLEPILVHTSTGGKSFLIPINNLWKILDNERRLKTKDDSQYAFIFIWDNYSIWKDSTRLKWWRSIKTNHYESIIAVWNKTTEMELRTLALFESILQSYTFIHRLVKCLFNDRLKTEKKNRFTSSCNYSTWWWSIFIWHYIQYLSYNVPPYFYFLWH